MIKKFTFLMVVGNFQDLNFFIVPCIWLFLCINLVLMEARTFFGYETITTTQTSRCLLRQKMVHMHFWQTLNRYDYRRSKAEVCPQIIQRRGRGICLDMHNIASISSAIKSTQKHGKLVDWYRPSLRFRARIFHVSKYRSKNHGQPTI